MALATAVSPGSTLRARLFWLAALAAAVFVGGATFLQNRITWRAFEREALDAAGATALGVAAELLEREPTPAELDSMLEQFRQAVPTLRAVTVVRATADGTTVDSSTEARPRAEVGPLAGEAIARRELVVSPELQGPERLVAVPLEREGRPFGAVVVSLSMEAVQRVRRDSGDLFPNRFWMMSQKILD